MRVPSKNTRSFAGDSRGLLGRKLLQCIEVEGFSEIIVSTDDNKVIEISQSIADEAGDGRISIVRRPADLAKSGTLDDFVSYAASLRNEGVLFWTHVTSPFFNAQKMNYALQAYEAHVEHGHYDSLMGVTKIHDFFWRRGKCISHDRSVDKWPQTQDIEPFFEVNSSVFMMEIGMMRAQNDRVGSNPFLFEMDKRSGFDVDWPEDFELAELMHHSDQLRQREHAF